MADYEGNGLAAFNDARSRGWSGSVTLADLEKLSAGNPIMQGIAAVWPDAPQSKPQSSVDWLRQYLPSSMGDWLARSEAEGLQWGKDMSNPRNAAGEVISTAMNLVPMGRLAVPRQGIRAYHGSPYDFDRFDISKIGTGEGAQAYGHGLYFAENPKTAQSYKNDTHMLMNALPENLTPVQGRVAQRFYDNRGNLDQAVGDIQKRIANSRMYGDSAASLAELHDELKLFQSGWKPPSGKMYEVNINAKPEQFLDWDRPLGQQPEIMQKLPMDKLGGASRGADPQSITGEAAWHNMAGQYPSGREYSIFPTKRSEMLRDAGIPGIRYLDQGSRQVTQLQKVIDQSISPDRVRLAKQELEQLKPTSNYVLFNDKIIDIMKKWSLAGAIPFAAASDYDGRF